MTTVGSKSLPIPDTVKGIYDKLEEKDKELDDLNEDIQQAKQEHKELRESNASINERLEALQKQLTLMQQNKSVEDSSPPHQSQSQASRSKWYSDPTDTPQWTQVEPPVEPPSPGAPSQSAPTPPIRVKPPRPATNTAKAHPPTTAPDKPPLPTSPPPSVAPVPGKTPKVAQPGYTTAVTGQTLKSKEPQRTQAKDIPVVHTITQHQGGKEAKPHEGDVGIQQKENKGVKLSGDKRDPRKVQDEVKPASNWAQPQPPRDVSSSQSTPMKVKKTGDSPTKDRVQGDTESQNEEQAQPENQHVDKKGSHGTDHVTEEAEKEGKGRSKPVKGHECPDVRPEHVNRENTKPADHYFNVVNHGYNAKQPAPAHQTPAANGNQAKLEENSKLVSVMHTNEEPHPRMYLFKFHASVSQSTIDGRRNPSRACAIISMLFAQRFSKHPSEFPEEGPIRTVPDRVFHQIEVSIREGNKSHEINCDGQPKDLGPEEVMLLTQHLDLKVAYETDVDTRELENLAPEVMKVRPGQAIMFIKNYRVVSLVPCNQDRRLLLFDSHPHFVITDHVRKMYGAYLFYVVKEEAVVRDLFMYHDLFCDPKPFFAKLVIFDL